MTTIRDIARISGYSIGTVSRVINNRADVSDEARQKIEEAIRESNYQPNTNARMLKQNASSEVSVIVHGYGSIFFAHLLQDIQIRMMEHGESVNVQFISETDDEVATAALIAQNVRPKGIIFLGGSSENFRKGFSQVALPCVLVTMSAKSLGFDNLSSFTTDDEEAAGCVMQKLLSKGHRRIGILGGPFGTEEAERRNDYSALRVRGAVKELEKNGIGFDFEKQYEAGIFTAESGYQAARRLLTRSPDLTGLFALTDAMAIGAVRAMKDMDLNVPGDVSVAGFNGVSYTRYFDPRIATIKQDTTALARKSVDDLLLRISYGSRAMHEKIPYEFVDGESIAPPRK